MKYVIGYITVKGGHRVGITGNCVIESGKVININYISSINFRIARQVFGCSNSILPCVLKLKENTIFNTLIVSPPGAGKTTLLRDLVRNISNGIEKYNFKGLNVGLIDERSEIAAMYKGIAQNEVGIRTDVLDNIPKARGMRMLIRSMAPQVIIADEIGTKEDVTAIRKATCLGVKGIFTAHGTSLEDLKKNKELQDILEDKIIEKIIFLNASKIGRNISVEDIAC